MQYEYKIVRLVDWENEIFNKELKLAGWELSGYSEFYFDGNQYKPKYAELARTSNKK